MLCLDVDTDISLLDFPVDEPGCDYCGQQPSWSGDKICACNRLVLICRRCKQAMEAMEARAVLNNMEMSCTTCGTVAPSTKLSELIVFHPLT